MSHWSCKYVTLGRNECGNGGWRGRGGRGREKEEIKWRGYDGVGVDVHER